LTPQSFFPCPNCAETIGSDARECKYCHAQIDPAAAAAALQLQRQINEACNDASTLRNLAGFMWVTVVIQFIYATIGQVLFFGSMIAVPLIIIRWQTRYGRLVTDDVDFKAARQKRNIALALWLPTPLVLIAILVVMGRS
jgi:hypothetical protein